MPGLNSQISTSAARARFEIRRILSAYPALFLPLTRRRPAHQGQVIDDTTEIVIEGFPRSGNTFAVAAFRHAQERPVAVARHLHAPAHVIEGLRRDLPVLLLLRDPVDAVTSQVIRHPELTIRAGLRTYVSFHRRVLPLAGRLVVAPFEQVTADFGVVVDALNDKFGTTFKRFDHNPSNVEQVFGMVEEMERADRTRRNPDPVATVARPTPDRQRMKEQTRARMTQEGLAISLRAARAVHSTLRGYWPP